MSLSTAKRMMMMGGGAKAAVIPWYLAGGIARSNVVSAYQASGVASYAASLLNLADNAAHALSDAGGIAPTWAAGTGWKGESGKYLITDFTPSANMSIICKFSGAAASNYFYCAGSNNGTGSTVISPYYMRCKTGGLILTNSLNAGVIALSISTLSGYANGILQGTMASTALSNVVFYILGVNTNGTPGSYFDGYLQAISFYSIDITPYLASLQKSLDALLPAITVPVGGYSFTYSSAIGV